MEPVVYAALSSSQPHKKGKNTTATVDQHHVTYATVDVAATSRKQAKAATLPSSPTGEPVYVIGFESLSMILIGVPDMLECTIVHPFLVVRDI